MKINLLIDLIQDKIKELLKKIDDNSTDAMAPSRVLEIGELLEENPFLLADRDFEIELVSYLNELENKEELKNVLNDLIIVKYVANAKKKGINITLNSDEEERLEHINNALLVVDDIVKKKSEQKKSQVSAAQALRLKYSGVYDKLIAGEKGTEHFTEAEIDLLLDIASGQDFNFKLELLEYIRRISSIINTNILEKNLVVDEYEEVNEVEIDEEILYNLFDKYEYQYDGMPNKYKSLLRKKCKVQKLISVFDYLSQNSEFDFLKEYGKDELNEKKYSILEIEFRRLYLLFRYASVDTLTYILEDAIKREVDVKDILIIDGVYKHISHTREQKHDGGGEPTDGDTISGCFEHYKANALLLDELSREYQILENNKNIDFYRTTLLSASSVFKTPPELVKRNIELTRKYKLPLVEKDGETYCIKSPTFLIARNVENLMDNILENPPLYDYIVKYPTLLSRDLYVYKAIEKRLNGELEFTTSGKLKDVRTDTISRLPNIDRSHINKIKEDIPSVMIEAALSSDEVTYYRNDDIVDYLSSTISNSEQNGLCFNLDGVLVSKYKFLRVWTVMMEKYSSMSLDDKNACDMNKLILFALTYDSYYTLEEVDKIKRFISEKVAGSLGGDNGEISKRI